MTDIENIDKKYLRDVKTEPFEMVGKLEKLSDLIGTEADGGKSRIDYEIDEKRLIETLEKGNWFIPKPLVLLEFKIKVEAHKVYLKKMVPKWNKEMKKVTIGYCRNGTIRRDYKMVYRGPGIALSWRQKDNEKKQTIKQ